MLCRISGGGGGTSASSASRSAQSWTGGNCNTDSVAFATTAAYDSAIASTLPRLSLEGTAQDTTPAPQNTTHFPQTLQLKYARSTTLRYGENPHQAAALYTDGSGTGVAAGLQLQGKELSFNNLVDLDACWNLVRELSPTPDSPPAIAIIKHTNPCGAAIGNSIQDAYLRALAADPVSAFGGVIGSSHEIDAPAAEEIAKLFVEAIVAPSFTPEALARFASKKNLRLLQIAQSKQDTAIKQISGGLLLQDPDIARATATDLQIVTERHPSADELETLLFAWRVCKHVKSNAIVYARTDAGFPQTVGIGAGQMSRVDAARFGAMKAVLPLAGSVAASDAFFPFADGLEAVADAGATAVIQPGGSVRDAEVIEAANRRGIAMAFTAIRHFRHG